MKAQIISMLVLVFLALMLISAISFAEADGERPAQDVAGSPSRMEPQIPVADCYYCVDPGKPNLWKWQVENRLRDLDAITRSGLNPESDLEYMMRTF